MNEVSRGTQSFARKTHRQSSESMFRIFIAGLLCSYGVMMCAGRAEAAGTAGSLRELRRAAHEVWAHGNIDQAAQQYMEVLAADEKTGEAPIHMAADLYASGSLAIEQDRLSEAQAYFQRALGIVRGLPLSEAEVRVSMGSLFALQGSFSDAEANLKSAIAAFTKYAGPNDLRTAKAWNGLGWLYTARGSIQDADAALRKAQSIVDSAVPSDSVDRIPFLDYHAEWLMQVGRYTDAERVWRQATAIGEKSLGKESPTYDVIWLHMGHLYTSVGEYKSAQDALERFLSIETKVMPRGSLSQAVALGELGNTYAHLKDHSRAEPTLLRSMDMLRTIPGTVPLANALVDSYLGDYYMSQNRWSDAADQYKLVLQTRQEFIPNTALVADSMGALAKALEKLKRKDEAKRYKKQAEAILSQQHDPLYSGYTVDVKSFRAR